MKLYCPICGEVLDQKQQIFRLHNGRAIVDILTCWNPACAARGRTTSRIGILDPEALADWKLTPKYDLETGEKLPEVCNA